MSSHTGTLALGAAVAGAAVAFQIYRRLQAKRIDAVKALSALEAQAAVAGLPSRTYELRFGAGTHSLKDAPPPPPEKVRIYDARGAEKRFDLHKHSFERVRMPRYSCDLYDPDATTTKFYALVEQLMLAQMPGATRVLLFDHLVRCKPRLEAELADARRSAPPGADAGTLQPKTPFLERPLGNVHADYTARSGWTRARQLLEPYCTPAEVEAALGSRFALVNVWHPFGPDPVAADPLALAVWGSFGPRDVRTKRLTFPHRVGETYQGVYDPAQAWVHFGGISRDDALLIKCFDSVADGSAARFSLHGAFRYPEQDGPGGESLPIRESIEVRCLVLYGEGLEGLAPNFGNASFPRPDAPARAKELAKLTELEIYNLVSSELLPAGDEW